MRRRRPSLYRRLLLHLLRHRPLTPEDAIQPGELIRLVVAAGGLVAVTVVWVTVVALSG